MTKFSVDFPVSEWIDEFLYDEYGIQIQWESEGIISHRDYFDVEIEFDLEDVTGSAKGIKNFMKDYDLEEDTE